MTTTELPDLFEASHTVTTAARLAFQQTLYEHMPHPTKGSTADADFEFPDDTWVPYVGRAPLTIATLLLSGANSVLTDLGDLVGAGRAPVTAPALIRYVAEHIAEIHWLLSPGTYTLDEGDPKDRLTLRESQRLFAVAQQIRIRRAVLRSYGWTLEFEHGRFKPAADTPRPASLPRVSPSELEATLEPQGLRPLKGNRRPSTIDPATKPRNSWRLDPAWVRPPLAPGPLVADESTTAKVNALAERFMAESRPEHAGLYAFLSTSAHPNPFAISEVGGTGVFHRPASEMARFVTVAVGAFACGLDLLNGYAGWDRSAGAELHDLSGQLRDLADAHDEQAEGRDSAS